MLSPEAPYDRPGMGTEGGIRSGLRSWMSISENLALRLVTLREPEIDPLSSKEIFMAGRVNESLPTYRRARTELSPEPVPEIERSAVAVPVAPCLQAFRLLPRSPATIDPLLIGEAPYSVSGGNKKSAICSGFVLQKEPSDGLEPSTPSFTISLCAQLSAAVGNGFGLFEPFSRWPDSRLVALGCVRSAP